LYESTLDQYINYSAAKKLLRKYLKNTKETEFTLATQDALTNFVKKAVECHITYVKKKNRSEFSSYKDVLDNIKNMNVITQSIDIPTRGETDILRSYSIKHN
jgi:DNA-directed RNA polymerase subunit F